MKKVLIIPSWYPNHEQKSSGVFFVKQAELLSKKFDVRILIAREKLVGFRKFIKHLKDFVGINLKDSKYYLDILPGTKVHQFEYINFTFWSIKKRSNRSEKAHLKYFLKNILQLWKPDVVHAHDVFNGGLVAEKIKTELKIPFVITSHTPISYDKWDTYKINRFKQNIITADKVIAVSSYDKRILLNSIEKDIDPVNLGNYIDDQQFRIINTNKAEKKKIQLLYVSTTSRRKDFVTLINAATLLKKQNIEFTLILVVNRIDDGMTLNDIQTLVANAKLEDDIVIHTEIYFKKIHEIYNATDIYVSSSYFETFGVAIAEAMACGIPVVTADNGGVRDIIENDINGIIVPVKDPQALANGILRIIKKEIVFNSDAIQSSVVEKYGASAYLRKLSMLYTEVLDSSLSDHLQN